MLSLFKKPLFNRDKSATPADPHALRLAAYERELGEPESDPGDRRLDGRDFVPDCEEGSDEGYVLLTNGMSEQRMAVPAGWHPDPTRECDRIEQDRFRKLTKQAINQSPNSIWPRTS
jgi:hypothetical protein